MEKLTPVQRVAVIAIGLALTLLVAMFFVPWAWKQVSELVPLAATRSVETMFMLAWTAALPCGI